MCNNRELKPCEYCREMPKLQGLAECPSSRTMFRFYCPRCNIASKSAYTIWGAIEAWNRRATDEKV